MVSSPHLPGFADAKRSAKKRQEESAAAGGGGDDQQKKKEKQKQTPSTSSGGGEAMDLDEPSPAPAKAGALAPLDVKVPAQNTGLGPEKTSFFQALNIPTKITKGTIEITNDVALIQAGDRVGMSESTLLNMLGISPFSYGLQVTKVYDSGSIFDPSILDITDDDLKELSFVNNGLGPSILLATEG